MEGKGEVVLGIASSLRVNAMDGDVARVVEQREKAVERGKGGEDASVCVSCRKLRERRRRLTWRKKRRYRGPRVASLLCGCRVSARLRSALRGTPLEVHLDLPLSFAL